MIHTHTHTHPYTHMTKTHTPEISASDKCPRPPSATIVPRISGCPSANAAHAYPRGVSACPCVREGQQREEECWSCISIHLY